MKQLTDQAFAQVREASVKAEDCIQAMTDGPHRGDWGNTLDVLEKALAALDTAQPVQVNAGYGELEAVMSAEFESHGFGAPESNKREYGRFRVGFASGWHSALTAAKQAQSATVAHDELLTALRDNTLTTDQRSAIYSAMLAAKQAQPARPINCGTGHCSCIECPYEQAQPECAPLTAEETCWACNGTGTIVTSSNGSGLIELPCQSCEAAIKQGGQQ